MKTFIRYARSRYFSMSHGWGRSWVKWLWLDAILFATCRCATLVSPWFRAWCREVDRLFVEQYDWPRSMVADTGHDSWIDGYWSGNTPQDSVDDEVGAWDGEPAEAI